MASRIATYSIGGKTGYGAVTDTGIVDLSTHFGKDFPTLREVIAAGAIPSLRITPQAASRTTRSTQSNGCRRSRRRKRSSASGPGAPQGDTLVEAERFDALEVDHIGERRLAQQMLGTVDQLTTRRRLNADPPDVARLRQRPDRTQLEP